MLKITGIDSNIIDILMEARMKKIILLFITITFLFSANSYGSNTIKIAAIFGKSGPAKNSDIAHLNAIRLAVDELNQKGGVLGLKIELLEFDHTSTALGARSAAKKAAESDITGVIGSCWSSHSQAMADVLQPAGIPMITPSSTNPDITLTGDFIFRVCFIDTFQGIVMAEFAAKDLKVKTAAILSNASSQYSTDLSKYFEETFTKLGGQVILKENYLQEASDFKTILEKVKAKQPEVIFVPGYWIDIAHIVKQARKMGLSNTFLGTDTWNSAVIIKGIEFGKHFFTDHWHISRIDKTHMNFIKQYTEQYSEIYSAGTLLSYDAVMIFADAVKRAGSLNHEKIKNALSRTENFNGLTGSISFNKHGDPIKPAYIIKYEQGKKILVKAINPQQ